MAADRPDYSDLRKRMTNRPRMPKGPSSAGGIWREILHPRDAFGRFRDKPDFEAGAKGLRVPKGVATPLTSKKWGKALQTYFTGLRLDGVEKGIGGWAPAPGEKIGRKGFKLDVWNRDGEYLGRVRVKGEKQKDGDGTNWGLGAVVRPGQKIGGDAGAYAAGQAARRDAAGKLREAAEVLPTEARGPIQEQAGKLESEARLASELRAPQREAELAAEDKLRGPASRAVTAIAPGNPPIPGRKMQNDVPKDARDTDEFGGAAGLAKLRLDGQPWILPQGYKVVGYKIGNPNKPARHLYIADSDGKDLHKIIFNVNRDGGYDIYLNRQPGKDGIYQEFQNRLRQAGGAVPGSDRQGTSGNSEQYESAGTPRPQTPPRPPGDTPPLSPRAATSSDDRPIIIAEVPAVPGQLVNPQQFDRMSPELLAGIMGHIAPHVDEGDFVGAVRMGSKNGPGGPEVVGTIFFRELNGAVKRIGPIAWKSKPKPGGGRDVSIRNLKSDENYDRKGIIALMPEQLAPDPEPMAATPSAGRGPDPAKRPWEGPQAVPGLRETRGSGPLDPDTERMVRAANPELPSELKIEGVAGNRLYLRASGDARFVVHIDTNGKVSPAVPRRMFDLNIEERREARRLVRAGADAQQLQRDFRLNSKSAFDLRKKLLENAQDANANRTPDTGDNIAEEERRAQGIPSESAVEGELPGQIVPSGVRWADNVRNQPVELRGKTLPDGWSVVGVKRRKLGSVKAEKYHVLIEGPNGERRMLPDVPFKYEGRGAGRKLVLNAGDGPGGVGAPAAPRPAPASAGVAGERERGASQAAMGGPAPASPRVPRKGLFREDEVPEWVRWNPRPYLEDEADRYAPGEAEAAAKIDALLRGFPNGPWQNYGYGADGDVRAVARAEGLGAGWIGWKQLRDANGQKAGVELVRFDGQRVKLSSFKYRVENRRGYRAYAAVVEWLSPYDIPGESSATGSPAERVPQTGVAYTGPAPIPGKRTPNGRIPKGYAGLFPENFDKDAERPFANWTVPPGYTVLGYKMTPSGKLVFYVGRPDGSDVHALNVYKSYNNTWRVKAPGYGAQAAQDARERKIEQNQRRRDRRAARGEAGPATQRQQERERKALEFERRKNEIREQIDAAYPGHKGADAIYGPNADDKLQGAQYVLQKADNALVVVAVGPDGALRELRPDEYGREAMERVAFRAALPTLGTASPAPVPRPAGQQADVDHPIGPDTVVIDPTPPDSSRVAALAAAGAADIPQWMTSDTLTEVRSLSGGGGGTKMAKLGGKLVIFKPTGGWYNRVLRKGVPASVDGDRERASAYIAGLVGMRIPRSMMRDVPGHGTSLVMEGVNGMTYRDKTARDRRFSLKYDDALRFAMFDAITGAVDRKDDNFMVDSDGRIWPIDNALAFPNESIARGESDGFAWMVEKMEGQTLPDGMLQHLRDMNANKSAITKGLRANGLEDAAIALMWRRVELILTTGKIPSTAALGIAASRGGFTGRDRIRVEGM